MHIFLTGATGFIGGAVLRELSRRGHHCTCLVRDRGKPMIDALQLPGVETRIGNFTQIHNWAEHLQDVDVVINAVGIIRESPKGSFENVHTRAPIALFEAATKCDVAKIVQISALGADEQAVSQYHLSKRAADRFLATLPIASVILRPSFVYGPQDQSMTFFQSMAASPITLVPGSGEYPVQPVHIDDLVHAVALSVESEEIQGEIIDVGGAQPLTFNRMLDILATRLGKRKARKIHMPLWIMNCVAAVTDRVGLGPITSDELGMLRRGNNTSIQPFVDCFKFRPLSFEVGIARKPLTEADICYARVKPLKLLLRLSIAFIWLATGLISAFVSTELGIDLLRQIGITGLPAQVALFGTSGLEIVIGAATAMGWRVRLMGTIQLLLMIGFTLILTWGLPHYWIDPFGPLTKNIPLIGATLIMMALEE